MKISVAISALLHLAAIAWALIAISGPAPFVAVQESGIEVDFALDSGDDSGRGEQKAQVDPKPAPLPTERPQKVADARNVGEANEDTRSREGVLTDKPLDTVKTSAAPQAEEANNSPVLRPNPVIDGDVAETPVPTTEVANVNEQRVPIAEEIRTESELPTQAPDAEATELNHIPVPAPAPANRPRPKTAQTRERRQPDEIRPQKTAASREQQKEITDRIGNLLNTAEDTASGARREEQVASIGTDSTRTAQQLTRGEYDALKGRIGQCWNIPIFVAGDNLRVVLDMQMARDGELANIISIEVSGVANPAHVRAIESGLTRNLQRGNCQFSDVLPREKYETWKLVRVNFQPQDF
jgi:hypothetical protein